MDLESPVLTTFRGLDLAIFVDNLLSRSQGIPYAHRAILVAKENKVLGLVQRRCCISVLAAKLRCGMMPLTVLG